MKIKVFDENHEKDLEQAINEFIKLGNDIIDIKGSFGSLNAGNFGPVPK